jgi:hypothetical protein
MPDELAPDLLRLFAQGDLDAFESLFKQFEIEVYRWILRIVRDAGTAEDVLVEAFWRAYRGRGQFDPSRSFGAWMRRIATNVARDHLGDGDLLPGVEVPRRIPQRGGGHRLTSRAINDVIGGQSWSTMPRARSPVIH